MNSLGHKDPPLDSILSGSYHIQKSRIHIYKSGMIFFDNEYKQIKFIAKLSSAEA